MRSEVAVLVPVLGRPQRVRPLVEAFRETCPGARMVFLADPQDREEIAAIEQYAPRARLIPCGGNYARKITAGVRATREELIFTGADDIVPQPGWFEAARKRLRGKVRVVGVNDQIDREVEHATHFLMTRSYALEPTLDGSIGPFCDKYFHNFCDNELIATAQKRGVYAYAKDAVVRHEHPMTGTAPDDDTYRRGRQLFRKDHRRFVRRSQLWT